MRSRRGVLAIWTLAAVVGSLLIILAGPWRLKFIEPGELSTAHQSLKSGPRANAAQCAVCHEEAHRGPLQWVASWGSDAAQSERCLACHDFGANAMRDHALPRGHTAALREQAEADESRSGRAPWLLRMASLGSGIARTADGGLACATCHKEHHGRAGDITHMDNNQCQVCHTKPFASLANGHPDFDVAKRRTPIRFDHKSHLDKHFRNPNFAAHARACEDCHTPDPDYRAMLAGPFERDCAACHADTLKKQLVADGKGIAILTLPALDEETINDHQIAIGDWPPDDLSEGVVSPFMKIILSSMPGMQQHMDATQALEDFFDLAESDPGEIESVARIAQAIAALFEDLASEGTAGLTARLAAALDISTADAASLTAGLSADTVRQARQKWWGVASGPGNRQKSPDDGSGTAGNWQRDDDEFALRYRAAGHADPFLRAWLDAVGKNYGRNKAARSAFDELAAMSQFKRGCLKCHTVSGQSNQGPRHVNWHANVRGFTKYNHGLHFKLIAAQDCSHCHQRVAKPGVPSGFVSRSKTECTSCHTPQRAGDSCLLCHNYHIDSLPPMLALPAEVK